VGFLLAWIFGCTTGALFELAGAPWAACALLLLAKGLPPRRRTATIWVIWCLLGVAWGAHRAPFERPASSPEGSVLISGTVARSSRVSRRHVRSVLHGATVDRQPLTRPLSLRAPGSCAWPVGHRYEGWAEVRSRGSAGGQVRLVSTALSPGPLMDGCHAVSRPHEGITLPNAETSGLLRALSIGDRSGLSPTTREAFIDTGTMHLLAISGLHLGVVAWGLYRLLLWLLCSLGHRAWTRDTPRLAAALSVLGIWTVVSQLEATDATLRAAWAISFVLLGLCWGRRLDGARALVLAAVGVVTVDPLAPLGASFQLSFLAVWAILRVAKFARRCGDSLEEPGRVQSRTLRRVGASLIELTVVNLTATAVTAPIGLSWFGQLSLVGPLVNLVATPWVALVVVPAIVVWTMIAGISSDLGHLMAPALDWMLGALLDVIEIWAELAGSSQRARWPLWAGMGASLGVIGLLGSKVQRRVGLVLLASSVLAVVLLSAPSPYWQMTAIDVGHGDAILLQGPLGQTALIDAGGHRRDRDRGRDQARWRVLPVLAQLGVDHLDLMVITHGDLDHVGGAAEVARRLPVGQLWLSSCPQRRAVDPLVRQIFAQGGQVLRVASGSPVPWGDATLEVLWPPAREPCPSSENDRSVVLRLETPHGSALLMGDASQRVESSLLGRAPSLLRADVLKVGHHGSDTSSSTAFLEASGAQIALVSGLGRRKGDLPSRRTLDRLRGAGLAIWVTGRDGSGGVSFEPLEALRVRRLRTP
jgi:competence protein ComEC